MKSPGLIGSTDGDAPTTYWRRINREVRLRLGQNHSASMIAASVRAEKLDALVRGEDWDRLVELLTDLARVLPAAGADGLVICGSVLNPLARDIGRTIGLPVVSIGIAMAETLRLFRYRRVVVVGTRTAREERMWHDELRGLIMVEPTANEQRWFLETAAANAAEDWGGRKIETNRIMTSYRKRGAQAVILAEPALAPWVNLEESLLPVFDAAEIHAWAAAGWALADEGCMLSGPPSVIRNE
jgi:aspartate racemase